MDHPYHSPARRTLRAAWPWLLLAVALGLWGIESFQHAGGAELPEGEPAPSVTLTTNDGEFDLEAERGHVVVLAFWATWCQACRAEAPVLSRVSDRIRESGDRVVGVSVDTMPIDEVRVAADRLGMRYPIALATPDALRRYQVELLPTIYVIAPDGTVARAITGTASEGTLLEAIEEARGEPSAAAR